jgi:hypothetical protein
MAVRHLGLIDERRPSDGTPATVYIDTSFNVVSVETR